MKQRYFKFLYLFVLHTLAASEAWSQDSTLENFSLKELLNVKVMTASRTSQNQETAPATIIVITREQIKLRGYQSLLDVLQDLPDVKVDDKIYSGIRNSITLRGTQGSEKMVILLDGNMISSPSGEAMPVMENYPVNLAEQIEVVYGPASALYGANAVSAVINIITRKSPSHKNFIADASTLADNYGYTNTTLFLSKRLADKVYLTLSGQYFYDKGVDYSKLYKSDSFYNVSAYKTGLFNTVYGPLAAAMPVRPAFEAPMQAYNIYASLNAQEFTFNFFRNSFTLPTSWGNNTSNALYNREVFMRQNITMANASYRKTIDKFTSTTAITVSQYNLDPESNYRNLYSGMAPAYKYSTATMIKFDQQMDYKLSEQFNLSAGTGYEYYNTIPQSADLDAPVNTKDYLHASYLGTSAYYRPAGLPAQFYIIQYHNIGTYLQVQYSPSGKFHFTAGARHDWNSRYGNTLNPRMGIVYKISGKTTAKLLYGTAFLAPTPSDAYSEYGSFYTADSGRTYHSNFLHLPNPGLEPIKSKNFELSIKYNISENFIVTINGYYTFLSGLHSFSDDNETTRLYNNSFNGMPVDYIEVFTNHNRQMNYGGSIILNGKHDLGKMQVNSFASFSYVNGKIEDGLNERVEQGKDAETDFISPFMGRAGLELKGGKFSCSPRLILVGRQNLSGIADTTGSIIQRQTIRGYALLNISAKYSINRQVAAFVNVSNALNQHYRAVGFNMDLTNTNTELFYGQRQDPIRVMAGFKWEL